MGFDVLKKNENYHKPRPTGIDQPPIIRNVVGVGSQYDQSWKVGNGENWFGRWMKFNRVLAPGENPDPYDSMQHQRKLVAARWGDYKLRQFDSRIDAPKSWRKLEKIGAPAVPKVKIERLDTQFRVIPNSAFEPWAVYKFDDETVPDRWSAEGPDKLMAFTEAQLKSFIAEAVAAERGNNVPNKARA